MVSRGHRRLLPAAGSGRCTRGSLRKLGAQQKGTGDGGKGEGGCSCSRGIRDRGVRAEGEVEVKAEGQAEKGADRLQPREAEAAERGQPCQAAFEI